MIPSDYLLGCLGQGPMTEMALIAKLLTRGHTYEQAVILTKNAIVDLCQAKRIELCGPSVYRIALSTPMEDDAKRATTQRVARPESPMQQLIREAREKAGQTGRGRGEA